MAEIGANLNFPRSADLERIIPGRQTGENQLTRIPMQIDGN